MARIGDTERLIWEQHATITDLRARLAEVEAERDIGIAEVEAQRDKALADLSEMTAGYTTQMETISRLLPKLRAIEARLAEVETWNANQARTMERVAEKMNAERRRADAAEARLAEVEAALLQGGQTAQIRCTAALLALDGWTTKRAEAEPVYPFGTPCRFAGTGCGEEYCTCAETVGHFCPIECVTCGAAGDDR